MGTHAGARPVHPTSARTASYMPRQHPERISSTWGAQPQPQCVSATCGCSLRDARRSPPGAKSPPSLGILAWLEKPRFRRNLVDPVDPPVRRENFRAPVGTGTSYVWKNSRKTHLSPRKTHFGVCPRTRCIIRRTAVFEWLVYLRQQLNR